MAATITVERIVAVLKQVPEKELGIIRLARDLADKKGEMDFEKLHAHEADIRLALAEAEAYANATESAVRALKKLKARAGGIR